MAGGGVSFKTGSTGRPLEDSSCSVVDGWPFPVDVVAGGPPPWQAPVMRMRKTNTKGECSFIGAHLAREELTAQLGHRSSLNATVRRILGPRYTLVTGPSFAA